MLMSKSMRSKIFLFASFISAVGDTLLVFAVPAGLGLETGDIRSSVCMWLIPAVAMFITSYLNKKIQGRHESAREDYGKLILLIAVFEITFAVGALNTTSKGATIALVSAFVFLYALAKEGIPRLLYTISIYRYFVESEEYAHIAGASNALNIAASFIGASAAACIIASGSWRLALILDALTFVIFGLTILFVGRDQGQVPGKIEAQPSLQGYVSELSTPLKSILIVVPLLFGVNALVWNYLPLLSTKFGLGSATSWILLIGALRLPGMISGFYVNKIARVISPEKLLIIIPTIFLVASFVFILFPNNFSICALIITQGIVAGLYWTSDSIIRNNLSHSVLINFNTLVLRRLAVFQFVACCVSIFAYSPHSDHLSVIGPTIFIAMLTAIALSKCSWLAKEVNGRGC